MSTLPFRSTLRTALTLALLLWPLAAGAAEAPPAVTGITGTYVDGSVLVQWAAPEDATNVARYRVYYSRESIVENGGLFDDFETTPDNATSFAITELPLGDALYVTVVAVSGSGEESETFAEEARVDIPQSAPTADEAAADGILRLLSAQPLSATGVLLTFSQPVQVDQQDAATAFRLSDASGSLVPLRTITINGERVTLETAAPLETGGRYSVRALQVRTLAKAGESPLLVDALGNTAAFVMAPEAIVPAPAMPVTPATDTPTTNPLLAAVVPQAGALPVLSPLQLTAASDGRGGAVVTASFDVTQGADSVSSFEAFQGMGQAGAYQNGQVLPANTRQIRFENASAGTLSVLVRAKTADGRVSAPSSATITLSNGAAPSRRTPLASTGAGMVTIFTMAGAVAGWRKAKKAVSGQ
ncbi:MAG: hypothetical protein PHW10_01905 [Candidatus Peribacteraceae bacterium]|nr:hypothetical protein [Candidatus Peribacteraceae bacterium]